MTDNQYVAIYVYGTNVRIKVKPETPCRLHRLRFVDGGFATEQGDELTEQTLELSPGVYGWFCADPVSVAIDGHAIMVTMRKAGKDPWPPPPPPPFTPDFATDELAQRLWALHWVGREGEAFMPAIEIEE